MKNMKKFLALALVAMTVLAVAIPAMALPGSYKPYLGGMAPLITLGAAKLGLM